MCYNSSPMDTEKIRFTLRVLLLAVAIIAFTNLFLLSGNEYIWYVLDVFWVLIFAVYVAVCMKASDGGIYVAALLFVPIVGLSYMIFSGQFFSDAESTRELWKIIDVSVIAIYAYLAGTKLNLK